MKNKYILIFCLVFFIIYIYLLLNNTIKYRNLLIKEGIEDSFIKNHKTFILNHHQYNNLKIKFYKNILVQVRGIPKIEVENLETLPLSIDLVNQIAVDHYKKDLIRIRGIRAGFVDNHRISPINRERADSIAKEYFRNLLSIERGIPESYIDNSSIAPVSIEESNELSLRYFRNDLILHRGVPADFIDNTGISPIDIGKANQISIKYFTKLSEKEGISHEFMKRKEPPKSQKDYDKLKELWNFERIEDRINSINIFPVSTDKDISERLPEEVLHDYNNGKRQSCSTTKYIRTKNFEEILVLNPNSVHIWPGAVLEGGKLRNGHLSEINLDRAPGVINFYGMNFPNYEFKLKEPKKAKVLEYISQNLPDEPTVPIGKTLITSDEADSIDHAMFKVGISAGWIERSAESQFNLDTSKNKRYFYIKFVQPYYTVSFDYPGNSSSFFKKITLKDIEPYVGDDNPPVYVSSVVYGRMLIAIVSTSSTSKDLSANISGTANLQPKLFYAGAFSESELSKKFQQIQRLVIAVGGNPENVTKFIIDGDIAAYLKDGALVSKKSMGEPISYQINYLNSNYTAKIDYTTSYYESECKTSYIPETNLIIKIDKICTYLATDTWGGKADIHFKMGIINHNDSFISLKETPKDALIQRYSDPECKNPILFNKDFEIDLPTRNGTCFTFNGSFWEIDPAYDDFVGNINERFCFNNGSWSPDFRNKNSTVLTADGQRWEVFYNIRQRTSGGDGARVYSFAERENLRKNQQPIFDF